MPNPCALGEIGLDHFHLPKKDPNLAEVIKDRQLNAFQQQLQMAKEAEMPVVITHAMLKECADCIDNAGLPWEKVIFHCFADGADEMRILQERGGHASFTGIITYKNAQNVREAALEQGLARLI